VAARRELVIHGGGTGECRDSGNGALTCSKTENYNNSRICFHVYMVVSCMYDVEVFLVEDAISSSLFE
jgi:hypothetical protein